MRPKGIWGRNLISALFFGKIKVSLPETKRLLRWYRGAAAPRYHLSSRLVSGNDTFILPKNKALIKLRPHMPLGRMSETSSELISSYPKYDVVKSPAIKIINMIKSIMLH